MKLKSRIKQLDPELLRYLAALCDTFRIQSVQKKMLIAQQLLQKYNVKYQLIGGATNRVVCLIGGYIFKFALDYQGYMDNQIEFSISRELQPFVPVAYETNGYIVVLKTIKPMTIQDFKVREGDIKKILSIVGQDYLLGDVGYTTKNYQNYGISDDGQVQILDYAYIHRATEKLFTCEVCGCGMLRYNTTYTTLKCSNGAECHAEYNYMDRKRIQGDQVDMDMIREVQEESIKLGYGETEVEVSDNEGQLMSGTVRVITSEQEYLAYIKEEANRMYMTYEDTLKAKDLTVAIAMAETPEERAKLSKELDDLYRSTIPEDVPKVVYEEPYDVDEEDYDDESKEEEEKEIVPLTLDELVAIAMKARYGDETKNPVNNKPDTNKKYKEYANKYKGADKQQKNYVPKGNPIPYKQAVELTEEKPKKEYVTYKDKPVVNEKPEKELANMEELNQKVAETAMNRLSQLPLVDQVEVEHEDVKVVHSSQADSLDDEKISDQITDDDIKDILPELMETVKELEQVTKIPDVPVVTEQVVKETSVEVKPSEQKVVDKNYTDTIDLESLKESMTESIEEGVYFNGEKLKQ